MTTQALTNLTFNRTLNNPAMRIIVPAGQTIRLPETIQQFAVVAGNAWVTMTGDDLVLQPGDTMSVENRPYPVILSAESKTSLTIECWQS